MKKPNIVFILSDDHGQWASGAYGNKDVISPNIDKLASKGIKFNNFFCASPVCSPARASILTGKIPSQHGIQDWLCGGNLDAKDIKNVIDKRINPKVPLRLDEAWKFEMRDETKAINFLEGYQTFTQVLVENGYHACLSGKWHLGATKMKQCGFESWYPVARGGTPYMQPEMIEEDKLVVHSKYVSDIITDNAINYLDTHDQEKPFFLSVHYTAPHAPWKQEDQVPYIWDMYSDCEFNDVTINLHTDVTPDAPTPKNLSHAKQLRRGYYSAITAMDVGIGRIIDKIDEMNLSEDTIIIYTSDNGMNLGQHGIWGKGNGTFPLNFYEESVKVPFIYYNPRNSLKKEEDSMVSHYDLFPTILDICSINYELDKSFPGKSFKSIIETNETNDEPVVILDEYGPNRMIRTKDFKYIHRYPYGPNEFYDLKNDPKEIKNVAHNIKYQQEIKKLKVELEKWFMAYVDQNLDGISSECYGLGQKRRVNRDLGEVNKFRKREN